MIQLSNGAVALLRTMKCITSMTAHNPIVFSLLINPWKVVSIRLTVRRLDWALFTERVFQVWLSKRDQQNYDLHISLSSSCSTSFTLLSDSLLWSRLYHFHLKTADFVLYRNTLKELLSTSRMELQQRIGGEVPDFAVLYGDVCIGINIRLGLFCLVI